MTHPCSGVILAGGLNTRLSGTNKAFITIGGMRIIDRIYAIFRDLFEEIILVTNDPTAYLEWDVKIVTDLYPIRSSLTGIHAGLFHTTAPHAFFSACDTPFLSRDLVLAIVEKIEPHIDVIVPETSEGFEPLCSVYSKRSLEAVERSLKRREFKIQKSFRRLNVKRLSERILKQEDPELLSFFNINSPEDKLRAESLMARRQELSSPARG